MEAFKAKGVEAIYCLAVNDKYVMKAWAESTPGTLPLPSLRVWVFSHPLNLHFLGCLESNIRMVADGSCAYTQALGMVKDSMSSGMGLRSMRYAAIIERGEVKTLQVDEKGMVDSSAENILKLLWDFLWND